MFLKIKTFCKTPKKQVTILTVEDPGIPVGATLVCMHIMLGFFTDLYGSLVEDVI